jgi:hypothetical protein
MTLTVGLLVALGMVAVVPLGLRLIDAPGMPLLERLWLPAAGFGVLSLVLPRGAPAAGLAGVYLLACLGAAAAALLRLRDRIAGRPGGPPGRRPGDRTRLAPVEVAVLTALVTPSVAGAALVAERAGHQLLGFKLGVLALTVAHFHFAGFAAALTAALVCRAAAGDRLAVPAALAVPAGTAIVFAGYFTSEWVELAGAVVLTAGMYAVGWLLWRRVRPGSRDPAARALFAVAAWVLAGTMVLALSWAAGEAAGLPHLDVDTMAATHGAANAVGFGLCGLLAWRRAAPGRI